ncbi:MAG: hypothetical protein L6271_01315 [Desulfobacteraceae bacterium]|nr:hypothetical protein [Desulfobacteraceae bacterium]
MDIVYEITIALLTLQEFLRRLISLLNFILERIIHHDNIFYLLLNEEIQMVVMFFQFFHRGFPISFNFYGIGNDPVFHKYDNNEDASGNQGNSFTEGVDFFPDVFSVNTSTHNPIPRFEQLNIGEFGDDF